jgi:hypothetical protein
MNKSILESKSGDFVQDRQRLSRTAHVDKTAAAVWEQPGVTVVAGIKYHAKKKTNALLKEAMQQIHDRRYYNRYFGKVILLDVAFAGKNVGYRMEVIHEK